MSEVALELKGVSRRYGELVILQPSDLVLRRGETVALLGPSGSGKSSLLHVAGLLERPSAGEVFVAGMATTGLDDAARTRLRRDHLGFVYQFHHLLPEFTALDNVALPQLIRGVARAAADAEAARLLTAMGLGERLTHQPGQLSGGEQQRTAIARALANHPRVLLADEPTGNLDPKTSERVFDALLEMVRAEGLSALIATHDHRLARRLDRVIVIRDQRLVE
ncbi:MAG TPA: ABC transporter, partial [Parvularcula sp.]|nr:ABC transporter [Parvularcula sp.]